MNTTSRLATLRATSGPWSRPSRYNDKSIPAVTPAEVYSLPSCTYRRSASTRVEGHNAASAAASPQWVVTVLPSSKPARARMKAPLQIEPKRCADALASRSQASNAEPKFMNGNCGPPATNSKS
ncbi:hypothetical protein D3C86_1882190 [compost metagenome]